MKSKKQLVIWRLIIKYSFMLFIFTSFMLNNSAVLSETKDCPIYLTSDIIANTAQKISPSVVSISTVEKNESEYDFKSSPFNDEMFNKSSKQGKRKKRKERNGIRVNASGTVLTANGYILTNYHVVNNVEKITVTTKDNREYNAKIIGKDKFTELAVIKIDATGLTPAPFGNSNNIRSGDWAIAIGSPLGLNNTVTLGIVSAICREIPITGMDSDIGFIQTDAAINPGNSGGPLVNLFGQVIGINTAVAGQAEGIGFAIPANLAKWVSDQLIAGKTIPRPWIGIAMSTLDPDLAKSLGVPPNMQGVVVQDVFPKSPADKAGLEQGDIIQRINGAKITSPKELQTIIRSSPINSVICAEILRDGKIRGKKITVEQWPEENFFEKEE